MKNKEEKKSDDETQVNEEEKLKFIPLKIQAC
jgi:hypothetical protein